MAPPRFVVITRTAPQSDHFRSAIEKLGLRTVVCPSITHTAQLSKKGFSQFFLSKNPHTWIVFTSSNGVKFFAEELKMNPPGRLVDAMRIAVVGPQTAQMAEEYGLKHVFIPSTFTAAHLARELPDVNGAHILWPRSARSDLEFQKILESRGAQVTDMPLYTTEYQRTDMEEFWRLLHLRQIVCLTFTSPSTVEGFMKNIGSPVGDLLFLPVVSIGPVTTKEIEEYGFTTIYTADPHDTEGMISKIKSLQT